MIPVKLTIQGIYSYQKKQTINFSRFTQASIFGIFGAVGSGKSTILEAITFALYGKTDRLNLSGDNRNYNMMNLKSNELFIEFIFRTGDCEYMAIVKGRRNSKQFEDVKSLDRTAYKHENDSWIPVGAESLENVIGLSYENFKRTIIIPQGKFQEFLQLSNKERSQMMKELFNLGKFELFYKVTSLEARNNEQLQNIRGKMQQIGEINPEHLLVMEESLKLIKSGIEAKSRDQAIYLQKEAVFRKLKELQDKIVQTEETIGRLKEQESIFRQLQEKIQSYEYCRSRFSSLLETRQHLLLGIKQYGESIEKDNLRRSVIIRQISVLEEKFQLLKTEYDQRETLNKQAEELLKIDKILELSSSADLLVSRITNGEKVCSDNEDKLLQLKKQKDELQLSIKNLRSGQPDMTILSTVKQWHTINQFNISARGNIQKDFEQTVHDIELVDKQIQYICKEPVFEGMTFKPENAGAILVQRKEQLAREISLLEKELDHLNISSALQEYAAGLEEGKPCPLCGSTSHPEILNPENVSEKLQNARKRMSKLKNAVTDVEQAQQQMKELLTKLSIKKEQLHALENKILDADANISAHQESFSWDPSLKNEKELLHTFELAEHVRKTLMQNEEQLEKCSLQVDAEEKNLQKSKVLLDSLRHQQTACNTELATLKDQLRILDFRNFESAETTKALRNQLLAKYREIETSYAQAEQQLSAMKSENHMISGRLEANQNGLTQEQSRIQNLEKQLSEEMKQSPYSSLSEVETVLSQILELEKEKKRLDDYNQNVEVSRKQLLSLKTEMGDKNYEEHLHHEIVEKLGDISAELTRMHQEIGKFETEISKLHDDLKTLSDLKELSESLSARAENIKTLKQLFKASGFVNFISSVYLQDLCNAANERFYKLTRHNLSLEITPDNNFLVRDFMNGGKTRSVKTLSGGQTFQAALSLALALADNIQQMSGSSQNFFFLDEGFGSLDKESLDIVFETLKSLRKENRIVGVISHVEEMQQEIDAHLKIINDEEHGSIVQSSF